MHTYKLKLPDDGISCAKEVEFEAPDGLMALRVAHQHAKHRAGELWCDGQVLCVIEESTQGFWQIVPVRDRLHPAGPSDVQKRSEEPRVSSSERRPKLRLRLG